MRESSEYNFVKVGNGRLALNHRPGRRDFSLLSELGCTHVVTLLKESEFAERIGEGVKQAGIEWIWLPVPNGNHPEGEVHKRLIDAMPVLSQLLDEGNSLLIHCSAGIHRTGTVAYGLLRWRGMGREEAMKTIAKIRKETAEGMMEKRMRWGDENARSAERKKPWYEFILSLFRSQEK
jgi:protein-tyrosine phosphatase